MTSNCCGAKIIMEDVCSDCKEHCEDTCSYCGFELETEEEIERGLCNSCHEMELMGEEYGIN